MMNTTYQCKNCGSIHQEVQNPGDEFDRDLDLCDKCRRIKTIKIDLTEEEMDFLLRVCLRAKLFAELNLLGSTCIDTERDVEKIKTLINKLSEKKCEKQ